MDVVPVFRKEKLSLKDKRKRKKRVVTVGRFGLIIVVHSLHVLLIAFTGVPFQIKNNNNNKNSNKNNNKNNRTASKTSNWPLQKRQED